MKDTVYDDFVERLRAESDIVSIVSEYVPLKKKGRNYWGCCPFHHEKTPSFSVTPEKGLFYCFGCQTGGNVFNFIMNMERLAFKDAIKLLAEKVGIPLPDFEKTESERLREKELAKLYEVNELARDFFCACLEKTGFGQTARDYLTSRGITPEVIDEFKIGLAPASWDKLCTAFQHRGITEDLLLKAGLAVAKSSNNGIYDRFRNRIMFPICDGRGRVIGFGGRVIDDGQPKYLNSPETLMFNKRHTLFALDRALKAIQDLGQAIVVEGYLDAITAHAYGFKNVVASLGTAFTSEQAKLLMRTGAEIIFAYDSDAAGQNATIRALDTVHKFGAAVRVITLPSGKDPDEYIRNYGDEAFKGLISNSLSFLDYKIKQVLNSIDYSIPEGKIAAIERTVPILVAENNAVALNINVTRLSQTLGIEENAINSEVQKYYKKNLQNKKDNNVKTGKNTNNLISSNMGSQNATFIAERCIIRLMFEDPTLVPYVAVQLPNEDIFDVQHREIINCIFGAYNMGKSIEPDSIIMELSPDSQNVFSHIMLMDVKFDDLPRLADDYSKAIKLARLKEKFEKHRLKADELQRLGDSNYLHELSESMRIQNEIKKLQKPK